MPRIWHPPTAEFELRWREWRQWHNENPTIWDHFERFAKQAVDRGRKVSHWLIINRIRWEIYVITTGEEFKISNDHIAFYARFWKQRYPQYADLFDTKLMIGEGYWEDVP